MSARKREARSRLVIEMRGLPRRYDVARFAICLLSRRRKLPRMRVFMTPRALAWRAREHNQVRVAERCGPVAALAVYGTVRSRKYVTCR